MNTVKLNRMDNRAKSGITTFGSYWAKGEITNAKAGNLGFVYKKNGNDICLQSEVRAIWPDGSLKWAAHSVCDASSLGDSVTVRAVNNDDGKYPLSEKAGAKV